MTFEALKKQGMLEEILLRCQRVWHGGSEHDKLEPADLGSSSAPDTY